MKVVCAKLCCVFSTMLLTTSLFAQTTVTKKAEEPDTKSKEYNYVPYGEVSSTLSGYQRKNVPVKSGVQRKKATDNMEVKNEDGYAIKRIPTITTPALEKKIIVEKNDTTSFRLYSEAVEKKASKVIENKEATIKTLPNSFFQQNNKEK